MSFQHAGTETMYDHIFTINADKYTAVDDEGLVTGTKRLINHRFTLLDMWLLDLQK